MSGPDKLTGIWMLLGGKPGAKALAGMVTTMVPPGTLTDCAGICMVSAGKIKFSGSLRRS
jgi:hypothetical protein